MTANEIKLDQITVALGVKNSGPLSDEYNFKILEGYCEVPQNTELSLDHTDPLDFYWQSRYGDYFPFQFGQLIGGQTPADRSTGRVHVFGSSAQALDLAFIVQTPGFSQVRQGRFIHVVDSDGVRKAEIELSTLASTDIKNVGAKSAEEPASALAYPFGEHTEFEHSLRIRTRDFVINERSFDLLQQVETFEGEVPVRYLKIPGTSPEIAFVFSAMSSVGDLTFNYKSSLQEFTGTQYYILDDSREQGAYYLCETRDFKIAKSVQSLLRGVISESSVNTDDVYYFGSSKGATAATWHGLTLGSGNIVVAAPQFLIGNFLRKPHPGILQYMAGGRSQEDIDWLNKAFERTVDPSLFRGKVRIMVGDKDPHRESHVPALVDFLRRCGADVETLPVMGANHGETGLVYASMLRTFSAQNGNEYRAFYAVSRVGEALRLTVSRMLPHSHLAVRVHHGNEQFSMEWYNTSHTWQWDKFPTGSVVFRVFEKKSGESEPQIAYTTKRLHTDAVESRKY